VGAQTSPFISRINNKKHGWKDLGGYESGYDEGYPYHSNNNYYRD
jgi:hypothetical protein